jgi:cytochrome P450
VSTAAGTDRSVHWDETSGAYLVTGFDAASTVLRGPGWSSDLRLSPLVSPELKDLPRGSLVVTDPPEHTRLRRLISPAFTPTVIASLRPRIAAIADAVLDGLPGIGPRIDVVADVGYPVSLAVICELLDVGAEGAQIIVEQTPQLVRAAELDASVDELTASAVANLELMLFLTPILARRREHPGRDFISALLALSDDHDPEGLSLGEVMGACLLLLVAGHETTANLIANSVLALLQHPDQIPHLLADPGRGVEELLRLHGPARRTVRTALVDQELTGCQILGGQAVLVDIRAANRDPWRFPDPLRMDLTRDATGHLAFGAGIHFCLGAALGRLEAAETLRALFTRHPRVTLAGTELRWRESTVFHALRELNVTLEST